MNSQTLNYHTRLHEWYRQHSIQHDTHKKSTAITFVTTTATTNTNNNNNNNGNNDNSEGKSDGKRTLVLDRHRSPGVRPGVRLPLETDLVALGILTKDKFHSIDKWCSDVNRNMFSVVKKEPSALYRKLRISEKVKAAIRDTNNKTNTGTRKVRSAEAFTLRGEWNKSPKPEIQGGELLASNQGQERNIGSASHREGRARSSSNRRLHSAVTTTNASNGDVDFCVKNSLDQTNAEATPPTMARVNHDSLDRRVNSSLLKKTANVNMINGTHSIVMVSPRGHIQQITRKSPSARKSANSNQQSSSSLQVASQSKANRRVKSGSVLRPPILNEDGDAKDDAFKTYGFNDRLGGKRQHSAKTLPPSHRTNEHQHQDSSDANLKVVQKDSASGENGQRPASAICQQGSRSVRTSNRTASASLRTTSASQSMRSLKTSSDMIISEGEPDEIRAILNNNTGPPLNDQSKDYKGDGEYPTFCSKCSGIYSGNAPPPPTPVTCGSCVHGITMNGKLADGQQNGVQGLSNAQIQKATAKRLVQTEKQFNEKITNANIQLKMSENRVTEDSIHYLRERELVRDKQGGGRLKSSLFLKTVNDLSSDFPDDVDVNVDDNDVAVSIDDIDANKVNYVSFNKQNEERASLTKGGEERGKHVTIGDERNIPAVHVISSQDYDANDDNEEGDNQCNESNKENFEYLNKQDSFISEPDDDHDNLSVSMCDAIFRGGSRHINRRMSIHFTSKPEVGNMSISNKLLHFLTIDDCKQAMRYHPHKVLEKHEVSENAMLSMASDLAKFQQSMAYGANEDETASNSEKAGAMRISKGSTITTLPFSSANNATNTNKKQYKILFDPEDLDYYKNRQPDSLSLAKAFNTLIYDRTIMRRLGDNHINVGKSAAGKRIKSLNSVDRSPEGPRYRQINAALKKHMGDKMAAQCQQMVCRYQRKKSGLTAQSHAKQNRSSSSIQSSERSLSLDSLPSVKKGIWRDSCDSLHQNIEKA